MLVQKNGTSGKTIFTESLDMYYDDRIDLSGNKVEIVVAGCPTSFQVGYGVEEETPDEAVLRMEGDTLIATGVGTALIKVEDNLCTVKVTAAPISLFLLIGQSNMEGMYADPNQSIVCPGGQVYSSYGDHSKLNCYTASYFAPSTLAGEKREINVNGTQEYLADYPVDSLTEVGNGKKGMDSGIAYEWNRITGEKVWVINAAHNAASISSYQPYCQNYEEARVLFKACQDTLKKEIVAGHYVFSHMGMFWYQGESDADHSAYWYEVKFRTMYEALKKDLSIDIDNDHETPENTLEFANIILPLAGWDRMGYRTGVYLEETPGFYTTFKELEMRGHRVGQLWMAANPDLPEINIVCNLGDSWMTMPDGMDGVEHYFMCHYENGKINYTTQVKQEDAWYMPRKTEDVKIDIHYNQLGFNEIGIESARNTCILLGYIDDKDIATTVCFVDWTGFREVTEIRSSTYGTSETLIVPIVSPIYRMKTVKFAISSNLKYDHFDLLAKASNSTGTITAICHDITARVDVITK